MVAETHIPVSTEVSPNGNEPILLPGFTARSEAVGQPTGESD